MKSKEEIRQKKLNKRHNKYMEYENAIYDHMTEIIKDNDYLDGYEKDTFYVRAEKGLEPYPGGKGASFREAERIREDDWLNDQQKELCLIRVYPKEDVAKFIKIYDKYLTKYWGFKLIRDNYHQKVYYEIEQGKLEKAKDIKKAIEDNNYPMDIKWYDYKWTRGHLYRTRYLRYMNWDTRQYCAYCGRHVNIGTYDNLKIDLKIDGKGDEVDHVIPIKCLMYNYKMDDGRTYREYAKSIGITRADSPLNLVASCHYCNAKKKSDFNEYYVKRAFKYGHNKGICMAHYYGQYLLLLILGLGLYYFFISR